jgi:GNAT superfamily N-acetyltransferase
VTVTEFREFAASDTEAAGRLLAARHADHRAAAPLLSARYETPEAAAAEVGALLEQGATGAVSVAEHEVTGYLLGMSKSVDTWGQNAWVESAGHAVTDPEDVRDLYAVAADRWAAAGLDAHYALVPAHDAALVDAWFRVGFGQQHVHAVREIPDDTVPPLPAGIGIRPARREDIPLLAELGLELPRHQGRSPVFSSGPVQTLEEALAEWEDEFDDEGFANLVAEYDGRVVGLGVGCALEKSSSHSALMRPDHAGFLGFAAVFPQARGLGAGRALGEAVLAWSRDSGYTSVATDWRATNLLSSRTWPRLGFRPTFLRLHRRLGY